MRDPKEADGLETRLRDGMEEVIEARRKKQVFWKQQADIYLVSTMKVGQNKAVYSARVKSSWRPEWMRAGTRMGRGKWMVGMRSPGLTSRQERAVVRKMNRDMAKIEARETKEKEK
jgi:L-2-hydroxyglutarate oxidase LhgO